MRAFCLDEREPSGQWLACRFAHGGDAFRVGAGSTFSPVVDRARLALQRAGCGAVGLECACFPEQVQELYRSGHFTSLLTDGVQGDCNTPDFQGAWKERGFHMAILLYVATVAVAFAGCGLLLLVVRLAALARRQQSTLHGVDVYRARLYREARKTARLAEGAFWAGSRPASWLLRRQARRCLSVRAGMRVRS